MCDWLADAVGRENVFLAVSGHEEEQREIGYPVASEAIRPTVTHLVFTGGGHFGEPRLSLLKRYRWCFRNFRRHLAWVNDYAAARKAIFGIGVGPISDPLYRHAVRRVMKEMQVIFVRDQASYRYIEKYRMNPQRLRLGIDLAMSIEPVQHSPRFSFGVHINGMPDDVFDRVMQAIMSSSTQSRRDISLIADGGGTARALARAERWSALNGHPLASPSYEGVDNLMGQIAACETVITSKLHVGIVATALGRKVVSLPSHQKTKRFYQDLGLQEFCLDDSRQQSDEIARMLAKEAVFDFDRRAVLAKISEMRSALTDFIHPSELA